MVEAEVAATETARSCGAGRRSEGVDVEALSDRLVAAALVAQGQPDVDVLLERGAIVGDGCTTARHCAPRRQSAAAAA
jgi:hypothetical protein